ncbi:hypothetical protein ACJBU6_09102 [Exserohilum turcicum]
MPWSPPPMPWAPPPTPPPPPPPPPVPTNVGQLQLLNRMLDIISRPESSQPGIRIKGAATEDETTRKRSASAYEVDVETDTPQQARTGRPIAMPRRQVQPGSAQPR